jgi:hypothetical protein
VGRHAHRGLPRYDRNLPHGRIFLSPSEFSDWERSISIVEFAARANPDDHGDFATYRRREWQGNKAAGSVGAELWHAFHLGLAGHATDRPSVREPFPFFLSIRRIL